MPKVK